MRLEQRAKNAKYETVDEYLRDAAYQVRDQVNLVIASPISKEDALWVLIEVDGDIEAAVAGYIEDLDDSNPKNEAHFSADWLNS